MRIKLPDVTQTFFEAAAKHPTTPPCGVIS